MELPSIDLSHQGMERYWDIVRETLETILNNHHSSSIVDKLRAVVEQCPIDEQELFYHAEPLTTAMDIEGMKARQLSDYHLQRYYELTRNRGWGRP